MQSPYDTEQRVCDRCGFDYKKSSLKRQRGMWLSHDCFDNTKKIQQPRTRWGAPRDGSTTLDIPPEAQDIVFTVTAAGGVSLISQTNTEVDSRDGRHLSFYMKVVSDGGPITISANPQIIGSAILGDLLTLRGTSDTDTISIIDGRGLRTHGGSGHSTGVPFTLADGDAISFVYTNVLQGWGSILWGSDPWGDGSSGASYIPMWVETSRVKGGI